MNFKKIINKENLNKIAVVFSVFVFIVGMFFIGNNFSNNKVTPSNLSKGLKDKQEIEPATPVPIANSNIKVGDAVQINDDANAETNGYDLTPHRKWYGVVQSITPKNYQQSNYEYYVLYGNGQHNNYVAEQDLTLIKPEFKVGDTVTLADGATYETNWYNLTPHRGWTGVIKSVSAKIAFSSQYEYDIQYGDGSHNVHVSEQDLNLFDTSTIQNAAFKTGQAVQINNSALTETNGYNLIPHRKWQGIIQSVKQNNYKDSNYEYRVVYGNGEVNVHVAEKDLIGLNPAFKAGDVVTLTGSATYETNWYNLTPHRNWTGVVQSVTPKIAFDSAYEYDIQYGNGQHNVHVSQQDLNSFKPVSSVTNTTTYDYLANNAIQSQVDKVSRVFYAIDQTDRADGLYNDPYGTTADTVMHPNSDAKSLAGKIVYATTEQTTNNGVTWVKINIDGTYKWIDKNGLSIADPITHSWVFQANNYNQNGQVVFRIKNSKFASNIRDAVAHWNRILGENVLIEASSATPDTDINLIVQDYNQDSGVLGYWTSDGYLNINTSIMGSGAFVGTKATNVIEHEFGHVLGLKHTGVYVNGTPAPWSWSDYRDSMWATNAGWDMSSQSIITQNDIDAVKLVRSFKDYRNTRPLINADTVYPVISIYDSINDKD